LLSESATMRASVVLPTWRGPSRATTGNWRSRASTRGANVLRSIIAIVKYAFRFARMALLFLLGVQQRNACDSRKQCANKWRSDHAAAGVAGLTSAVMRIELENNAALFCALFAGFFGEQRWVLEVPQWLVQRKARQRALRANEPQHLPRQRVADHATLAIANRSVALVIRHHHEVDAEFECRIEPSQAPCPTRSANVANVCPTASGGRLVLPSVSLWRAPQWLD